MLYKYIIILIWFQFLMILSFSTLNSRRIQIVVGLFLRLEETRGGFTWPRSYLLFWSPSSSSWTSRSRRSSSTVRSTSWRYNEDDTAAREPLRQESDLKHYWRPDHSLQLTSVIFLSLSTEGSRVSPGPVLGLHSLDRVFVHGSAVVRGGDRHLHRTHRLHQDGNWDLSTRGTAQVPWSPVRGKVQNALKSGGKLSLKG